MRIAQRLIAAAPLRRVKPPRSSRTINPDGVAAGTRGNAHGVDLNRNFPYRWRPLTGGEYSGARPLSEPESRAAHRLILREKPDLTIWFHQPFGLIDRPNGNPFAAQPLLRADRPTPRPPPRPLPRQRLPLAKPRFPRSTAFVAELPPRSAPRSKASTAASAPSPPSWPAPTRPRVARGRPHRGGPLRQDPRTSPAGPWTSRGCRSRRRFRSPPLWRRRRASRCSVRRRGRCRCRRSRG